MRWKVRDKIGKKAQRRKAMFGFRTYMYKQKKRIVGESAFKEVTGGRKTPEGNL